MTQTDTCEFRFEAGCDAFIFHEYDVASAGLYYCETLLYPLEFDLESAPENDGTFKLTLDETVVLGENAPLNNLTFRVNMVHGDRGVTLEEPIIHTCSDFNGVECSFIPTPATSTSPPPTTTSSEALNTTIDLSTAITSSSPRLSSCKSAFVFIMYFYWRRSALVTTWWCDVDNVKLIPLWVQRECPMMSPPLKQH